MNIKKEPTFSPLSTEPKRLLSITEASTYIGLGRSSALSYLESIGAKRKIGRRTLYDKLVIDEAISNQAKSLIKSNLNS